MATSQILDAYLYNILQLLHSFVVFLHSAAPRAKPQTRAITGAYCTRMYPISFTCSKYCNLIGLSEVHYFHRDLQAKIETYNFYKIYKIVLISKKTSLFSVLLLSETKLFSQLALILLPHTFPSSCYCCLVGSGGSFN